MSRGGNTTFKKGQTPWNKGLKGAQVAWNKGKKCPDFSERQLGNKNHRYGKPPPNKGVSPSKETREKISASLKGKIPWNKNKKTGMIPWNKGTKGVTKGWPKGMKQTKEHIAKLGKIRSTKVGPIAANWRGGITPINQQIRDSIDGTLWKNAVFSRDNYTCQKTGVRGEKLVAHHIFNFATHKEMRFAIDNGVTLSVDAHRDFHKKYGTRRNTAEQLAEFLTT